MLPRASKIRTLVTLGRVSNLPTVWSNCLAGWTISGGGKPGTLFAVTLSISFLYVGGMFLNDAFDADYDRSHRPTRPIPSGAISELEVWSWGLAWMVAGIAGLIGWSYASLGLTIALAAAIVVYNIIHKMVVVSPIVMGGCRMLVYLIASSASADGLIGEAVWKGCALAVYVMGLSWLARAETGPKRAAAWPCILLAAPLVVAALMDDDGSRLAAVLLGLLLAGWIGWIIWPLLGRDRPNVGHAVSGLLAGIALVDLLAMAGFSHFACLAALACFGGALAFQRWIPAT